MKKILLAAFVSLVAMSGYAQAGQMAAGVNLGFAPSLESGAKVTNFGIGGKFQYGITDKIRVEADLEYWLKDKGISVFDVTANAHYLFNVMPKLRVYPLVGIGIASCKASFSGPDYGDWEDWFDDDEWDYYSVESRSPWDDLFDDDDLEDYLKGSGSSSSSKTKFLFNVGVGAEYDLTDKVMVNFEIKYQYIKDFNRLPIQVGVAYKF